MRILLSSDVSIHDVIGGAERVLFEQAIGLQGRGHDVHILTRRLPEHLTDQSIIQNVCEWRYNANPSNSLSFLLSTLINGTALFNRLQIKYGFEFIIGHQPFSAWVVNRSSLARSLPFFYTCHSLSFEEYVSRSNKSSGFLRRGFDLINAFLLKQIEKHIINEAQRIIVLSKFTHKKLMTIYEIDQELISIIPGGVDIHKFSPARDRNAIRNRLRLPPDRFILLTVRNLVPRMGLENLIDAMRSVVNAVPEICLVVGGTGPLKSSLVKRRDDMGLHDHVLFTGFIPETDLPDYYRAADIFVLPTIELEGFGLVTLEALASGTPVLGTPIGGTQEILGQLDKKYLFRDVHPDALAELIIETSRSFIEHPEEWQTVSLQCRQFVEQHYTWERNINALEKVLTHVRDLR